MSMHDEGHWAKEYQWLFDLYNFQLKLKKGKRSAESRDALLSRESVYRVLELLAFALVRNCIGGLQGIRNFYFSRCANWDGW